MSNLLQKAKYNLLLPRTGIRPLDFIVRTRPSLFERLTFKKAEGEFANAALKDVFKQSGRGGAYPKIKTGTLPDSLKDSDILDTKIAFVTNFLEQIKANAALNWEKKVVFSFENATRHYANTVQIDEYMNFGEVNQVLDFYDKLKAGEVYIITEVLQSAKLSLRNAVNFHIEGEVTTHNLTDYLGELNAKNAVTTKNVFQFKNESEEPLVFALKAAKIIYKNLKYRIDISTINVRNDDEGMTEGIESEEITVF